MTVSEQRFLERVPSNLNSIDRSLEKISNNLEKLTELVVRLYGSDEDNV